MLCQRMILNTEVFIIMGGMNKVTETEIAIGRETESERRAKEKVQLVLQLAPYHPGGIEKGRANPK
jgi:hypothetical protein